MQAFDDFDQWAMKNSESSTANSDETGKSASQGRVHQQCHSKAPETKDASDSSEAARRTSPPTVSTKKKEEETLAGLAGKRRRSSSVTNIVALLQVAPESNKGRCTPRKSLADAFSTKFLSLCTSTLSSSASNLASFSCKVKQLGRTESPHGRNKPRLSLSSKSGTHAKTVFEVGTGEDDYFQLVDCQTLDDELFEDSINASSKCA